MILLALLPSLGQVTVIRSITMENWNPTAQFTRYKIEFWGWGGGDVISAEQER